MANLYDIPHDVSLMAKIKHIFVSQHIHLGIFDNAKVVIEKDHIHNVLSYALVMKVAASKIDSRTKTFYKDPLPSTLRDHILHSLLRFLPQWAKDRISKSIHYTQTGVSHTTEHYHVVPYEGPLNDGGYVHFLIWPEKFEGSFRQYQAAIKIAELAGDTRNEDFYKAVEEYRSAKYEHR